MRSSPVAPSPRGMPLRPMVRLLICALAAALAACTATLNIPASAAPQPPNSAAPPLLTIAEASNDRKTATHQQVLAFSRELAERSLLVHLSTIGTSHEERDIPLLVIADPPVASADEAKKSGKPIVLLLGGIHAGECDGKEALLMLARELVLEDDGEPRPHELLKDLIVALVPIYNPDGNERLSPDNRPGQVGPDEMGIRANAQGLDLNRDFVKLEAPETRALLAFINRWDPAIIVDTHTTNGSYHRYLLTYDGPRNPAGDPRIIEYVRETMLPQLTQRIRQAAGIETFWYGNFAGEFERGHAAEDRHSRWETYPDLPRYGVPCFGLRNRIGILTESYSYATYRQRIEAQLIFIRELLAFTAQNRQRITRLIADADSRASTSAVRTERPRAAVEIAIRSTMTAAPEKATILGYVEEVHDGRIVSTGQPFDYVVDLYTHSEPERSVPRAYAYILSAPPATLADLTSTIFTPRHPQWMQSVIHNLQRHGISIQELREDVELEVTAYRIQTVTRAMRPFQGHMLVTVRAEPRQQVQRLNAGSYIVRTAQPLGALATCLLEPESADGLAVWNFFDEALEIGRDFPVLRLEEPASLLTVDARPLPEDRQPLRPLTFEAVYESSRAPNLGGNPVAGLTWIDDQHYLHTRDNRLHKIHAPTGRSQPFHDPARMAAALAKLPSIDRRAADSIARRTSFTMDQARAAALIEHRGDLYWARFDGSRALRLTSNPSREELATFSPDGAFVAFVRDNDLWVVDIDTQRERQLTTGGHDLLRHGKADWVYFEEVFGRNWRVYWWSPDSTRIAYMRVDSRPVRTFTIVSDIPDPPNGQTIEVTPYPKAGTPNPRAALFIVDVAGGDPRAVDLSAYNEEDMLILGAGWWPDSSALYACISNRTQMWVDVLSAPPSAGRPRQLFRETSGAWVSRPPPLHFQADGSFIFSSERDGWMHLYHYQRDGAPIRRITEGPWEVRSIARADEALSDDSNWLYFHALRDSPIAQSLYRVRLDGSGLQRLTHAQGAHTCTVSPGGHFFTASWSSHTHPARVALFELPGAASTSEPNSEKPENAEQSTDTQTPSESSPPSVHSESLAEAPPTLLRILDTNPVRDLERFQRLDVHLVQIPTPDGHTLEGALLFPPDFDPGLSYPVWFTTYGGPKAPTISDSWMVSRIWDQVLAHMGFIVFRADPYSASGKGAISAWTAYRQMGIPELRDIEHAIAWIKQYPWADPARIGISGHSYGGFITAFAMTNSTLFAAGIAGAPVTDWRLYDSIYTERYMLTPQENPDGYHKTSVIASARNLHGRLLLLHGMMDDNVHMQNVTRLVRAFQNAGVQNFELMLYPDSRHGLGGGAPGRHYQRLMIEFIKRTLGESPQPRPREIRPDSRPGETAPPPPPERTMEGPSHSRSPGQPDPDFRLITQLDLIF
jgi:dipeptidyl-peptidase 4